jgi:hypothetical protein
MAEPTRGAAALMVVERHRVDDRWVINIICSRPGDPQDKNKQEVLF